MQPLLKDERRFVRANLQIALTVACAYVAFQVFGYALFEAFYAGTLSEWAYKLTGREAASLSPEEVEFYARRSFNDAGGFLQSVVFWGLCAQALSAAVVFHRRIGTLIRDFFDKKTSPANLAVFRIVLFAYLLFFGVNDVENATWWAGLPSEFRVVPHGIGQIIDYEIFSPQVTATSHLLFQVFCVTGVVGLFSRTSALMVTLLGIFPLAAAQFLGKVCHTHHVFWFTALLAASPCGDALSVDALLQAWRRAGRGAVAVAKPSKAYAVPLRFVWVLMGIIYFFPGFWKLQRMGLDWAFSDNLVHIMHAEWFARGGWTPFFRIDQFPVLVNLTGLSTLLFELSFIFLIFVPRWRQIAAASGLLFHNMTWLFMNISYLQLQVCYVAFVDWHRCFRRVGIFLFSSPLVLCYDSSVKRARQTVAVLKTLDLFRGITYSEKAGPGSSLCIVSGGKRHAGLAAVQTALRRIPLLWPVLPAVYLSSKLRHSFSLPGKEVVQRRGREGLAVAPINRHRATACVVLGTFLVSANLYYGGMGIGSAWPFACYPKFASKTGPSARALVAEKPADDGDARPVDLAEVLAVKNPVRSNAMLRSPLIGPEAQRKARLKALRRVLEERGTLDTEGLRFKACTFSTHPDSVRAGVPPRECSILAEF